MAEEGPNGLLFQALGPLQVTRDGHDVAIGPGKQRAVLAVLLLQAGRPVSRDEIVAGVWGEQAPVSAGNLVATYIAGLRRALLPSNPLVSFSGGYLLRAEPDQIDLRLLEAELASANQARDRGELEHGARMLSAALDRWRGQPLDGVPGPHAEQARGRLAECRLAAMVQRIEVELARGRHADCVDELSRLVAAHPLREPLYGLLMLALYRSGRQAEALMVFHDARRKLADELGIEPCASLRDLFQRIITDDGPEMTSSGALALGVRKPRQLPPDLPDFAGREVELAQLTKHLAAVTTTALCVLTARAASARRRWRSTRHTLWQKGFPMVSSISISVAPGSNR